MIDGLIDGLIVFLMGVKWLSKVAQGAQGGSGWFRVEIHRTQFLIRRRFDRCPT
jgi:hypothetical protein